MDPPNMDFIPYRFGDQWSIFFTEDIEGSYQEEKIYDEWMWDELEESPPMPASYMLAQLNAKMDDIEECLDAVEEEAYNFLHTEATAYSVDIHEKEEGKSENKANHQSSVKRAAGGLCLCIENMSIS